MLTTKIQQRAKKDSNKFTTIYRRPNTYDGTIGYSLFHCMPWLFPAISMLLQCFAMAMQWMDCLCEYCICLEKCPQQKQLTFLDIFRSIPCLSYRWKSVRYNTFVKMKKLRARAPNYTKNCFWIWITKKIVFNNLVKSLCTQSRTSNNTNTWKSLNQFASLFLLENRSNPRKVWKY